MPNNKNEILEYWDNEYKKADYIYGLKQSILSEWIIKEKISNHSEILELGGGYARDAKYLVDHGLNYTTIDFCKVSCEKAKNFSEFNNLRINIVCEDILEKKFSKKYDLIFSYHFLHLFSEVDLIRIVDTIYNILQNKGITYHILLSDSDFTAKKFYFNDRPSVMTDNIKKIHYHSVDNINNYFNKFAKMDITQVKIEEEHNGYHVHNCLFIKAIK